MQLGKTLFRRPQNMFSLKRYHFMTKFGSLVVSASLWFMVARPCKKSAAKVNAAKTVREIDRVGDSCFLDFCIKRLLIFGF